MPDLEQLQSQFYIALDGSDAEPNFMRDLERVTVETSLHLPDMATLVLHDPQLRWVDHQAIAPGTSLKVAARAGRSQVPLFDGEIVEIEPDFGATQQLTIRAFDRLHRLARGQLVRSFVNVTDEDLVRQIASEVGLQAEVKPVPRELHAYVLQANETNLIFLQRRASALGYLLFVEGTTLFYKSPEPKPDAVEVAWGETLHEFRPRMTTIGQVSRVVVRGWDPATKRAVFGEAHASETTPRVGTERSGGAVAEQAFQIIAETLVADRPLRDQAAAAVLAQAVAERHAGRFIEAEGRCAGLPRLVAGADLAIRGVGTRFSGTYFVTSATHSGSAAEGYQVVFSVSGLNPLTLLSLLAPEPAALPTTGLVIGVVTDNNDPDNLGRVKVMFPWLSPDHASDWARVASIGGGHKRGIEFLPEVNDEVLVGFEMGDVHQPYVLGGLWNGADLPPYTAQQLVKSGEVRQRAIVSRAGHQILFDDSDSGGISIRDSQGNQIQLVAQSGALAITTQGSINLKAGGNLALEAAGSVTIQGKQVTVEGQASVDIKGRPISLN